MKRVPVKLNGKNYNVDLDATGKIVRVECKIAQFGGGDDYRYRPTWDAYSGKPATATAMRVIEAYLAAQGGGT